MLPFLIQICTKSFVGWGFTPDPTGELTCSPDPLAVFRRPTSRGREGKEKEGRGGGPNDPS